MKPRLYFSKIDISLRKSRLMKFLFFLKAIFMSTCRLYTESHCNQSRTEQNHFLILSRLYSHVIHVQRFAHSIFCVSINFGFTNNKPVPFLFQSSINVVFVFNSKLVTSATCTVWFVILRSKSRICGEMLINLKKAHTEKYIWRKNVFFFCCSWYRRHEYFGDYICSIFSVIISISKSFKSAQN